MMAENHRLLNQACAMRAAPPMMTLAETADCESGVRDALFVHYLYMFVLQRAALTWPKCKPGSSTSARAARAPLHRTCSLASCLVVAARAGIKPMR
jgi:hypothetical protein